MKSLAAWAPSPNLNVLSVSPGEAAWIVELDSSIPAACPECGTTSSSRHSSYHRTLQDLPAQGTPITIRVRATRWRCSNDGCDRRIFAEQLPQLAARLGRRTARLAEIVRLFGHSAGGRPSERLMSRLGMPVSDSTILRSVMKGTRTQANPISVRVAGIDEWAWRKGLNYGTMIVDLEQRQVVALLADRSASTCAAWFRAHPELEVVSRDRAGLYADAARQGAPQARQIADRFHILMNFRETIERQLGRYEAPIREPCVPIGDPEPDDITPLEGPEPGSQAATEGCPRHCRPHAGRAAQFAEIRALYESGSNVREIAEKLGLGRRRVYRWVCRIDFPERNVMTPKPSTPAYFDTFLAASWAQGTTKVRHLFSDIRHRGYTGTYGHVARFVAPWRKPASKKGAADRYSSDEDAPAPPRVRTIDPMTGRQISPIAAAALCVKPRGQMTERQLGNLEALKETSTDFCVMRRLAMRLRGLLRGGTADALDLWLNDARSSNIHGMRRFARTVRQDMAAVSNAVLEPWSNGQVEG
ncbi:MAG TPA: ISL3 family transposase, partial [Acetobacteraceae bacterium]|nr:ISL3 family transposase [Acetobacteraceae bacterium]